MRPCPLPGLFELQAGLRATEASVQLDEIHSFTMTKTKHTKHRYYSIEEEEEEAIKRMDGRKRKEMEDKEIGDTEGPEETREQRR